MATIKEKIQKLLALATSSNENEARDAMLKAKELMIKNKLSEEDFEEVKNKKLVQRDVDDIKWTTDSGKTWVADICSVIGDEYLCSCAWFTPNRTRTHTLIITGMEDDVDVCESVIRYALGFVEGVTKKIANGCIARGKSPAASVQSYAKGFLLGLQMAFEEQRDEHPEWGLVVVKPEEVLEFEKTLKNKTVKTKKQEFDPLAYMMGQEDGRNFNAGHVLEEKTA